jgi:hypothetical protein
MKPSYWLLAYSALLIFVSLASIADLRVEPDPPEKPVDPLLLRFLDHVSTAALVAGVIAVALHLPPSPLMSAWRWIGPLAAAFFVGQSAREVHWYWTSPHSRSSHGFVIAGSIVTAFLFAPALYLNIRLALQPVRPFP